MVVADTEGAVLGLRMEEVMDQGTIKVDGKVLPGRDMDLDLNTELDQDTEEDTANPHTINISKDLQRIEDSSVARVNRPQSSRLLRNRESIHSLLEESV
jgi:hypothetical protein